MCLYTGKIHISTVLSLLCTKITSDQISQKDINMCGFIQICMYNDVEQYEIAMRTAFSL